MPRARTGLLKVLEYRRLQRRGRQMAVGRAEARLAQSLRRVHAAQQQLRDGATGPEPGVQRAAALQTAARHAAYLRRRLQQEQRDAAAVVRGLADARVGLTAAARAEAAVERLLARRDRERELEQARRERAMHDECAARAHARMLRSGGA